LLDVIIQRDPALFNQTHRAERKDWLAHRSGLEQGIRIHRISLAARTDAESALPRNTTAIDDGYAHPGVA
jgi:hypothetical protein